MGLSERKIWLDGELVPWERATVHVLSQSIQRGSLVFDVMACYGPPGRERIFGLREHVDRFLASAALVGMDLGLGREAVLEGVARCVRANPGCEIVKVSGYYTGVSLDVLPRGERPSVAIAALSIRDVYGADLGPERPPARLQVAESIKTPPNVLSPQAKIAASYTSAAVAKQRARRDGFDDILFLDARGKVAESSTQSFFLVAQGGLRTASLDHVLAGITRRAVLELAADEGIAVKEEPTERVGLGTADEAFLTGTTIDVWPVGRIDARELPAPVPGPVTARLAGRLARVIEGADAEFSPRWMQALD
jgi:branched-chain amino acid aminotransferase